MDFHILQVLRTEYKILHFLGFYCTKFQANQTFIERCLGIYFVAGAICFELSLIADIFLNLNNFTVVIGVMFHYVQQTGFLVKLFLFLHNRPIFAEMEHQMNELNDSHDSTQTEFFHRNYKIALLVSKTYRSFIVTCCTLFTIGALIQTPKTLSLPGYIPFDIDQDITFIILFIVETTVFYGIANLNSTIDITNCKLIAVACAMIEVLADNLNKIGTDDHEETQFKNCVLLHGKILRFAKNIENLYCFIAFAQIATGVLVICLTAMELIIVPFGSGEFFGPAAFLIVLLTETSLYCWSGQNLKFLSENLNKACYTSNWYTTHIKVKKMIVFFMERAKWPIVLTAGKYVPLTLVTLTMILRSSYSFFALLQQVYSN